MRCLSASTASHIIYGARSTMKGRCLRFLPPNGGIAGVALKFLKRAMKRYGRPVSIVTDRLRSYRAALKAIGNEVCQKTGRWLNNRAETSHQPFRRRERAMARFKSERTLQKFAAVHASIHNHSHGEWALRPAGQTHIRSPGAPAAPTSRFRRWRLRRTGPLFNTAISAKWLSGPSTWIRQA